MHNKTENTHDHHLFSASSSVAPFLGPYPYLFCPKIIK